MKSRAILTICLLALFLLSACAPAASPTLVAPEAPVEPALQATEPPAQPEPLPTESQPQAAQTEVPPTEAPTEPPQVVATSRGPDLESTDPATVSLASGELQLVEFFRYT